MNSFLSPYAIHVSNNIQNSNIGAVRSAHIAPRGGTTISCLVESDQIRISKLFLVHLQLLKR